MAKLIDLPNEILLLQIVAILDTRKTYFNEDLYSLSYTCKELWQVLAPLLHKRLYRSIRCTWHWDSDNACVGNLLRSILERPELARLIERIEFLCSDATRAGPCSPPEPLSNDLWVPGREQSRVEMFFAILLSRLSHLRSLTIDSKLHETWRHFGLMLKRRLITSPGSSVLELLDCLEDPTVKRVTPLAIGYYLPVSDFSFLERITSQDHSGLIKRVTPLARGYYLPVSDFSVLGRIISRNHPRPEHSKYNATTLESLVMPFFLRSLKHLDLVVEGPIEYRWLGKQPYAPALTRLKVERSQVTEALLRQLLLATPNLQDLIYGLKMDANPEDGTSNHLDCDRLRWALEPVQATLRYLEISISFSKNPLKINDRSPLEYKKLWGIKGVLGSLASFSNLEILEIPVVLLLGWSSSQSDSKLEDILPNKRLRDLNLVDNVPDRDWDEPKWNGQNYLDRILLYLENVKTHTPSLKHLVIEAEKGSSDWEPMLPQDDSEDGESCERLAKACFDNEISYGVYFTEAHHICFHEEGWP